jgi:Putative transposase
VRVLSRLFRGLFLHYLENAFVAGKLRFFSTLQNLNERTAFLRHLAPLRSTEWVVYAKRPFAGPKQVLEYLGRYTHRIAISNNRLRSVNNGKVRFRWKDYRNGHRTGTMTLTADEFIRRFLLHVLPDGFQRIRYYGFLANRHREAKLTSCRELLGMSPNSPTTCPRPDDYREYYETLTGRSLKQCPICQRGNMVCIEVIPAISPPQCWDTS